MGSTSSLSDAGSCEVCQQSDQTESCWTKQKRHDKSAVSSELEIGSRVLLRNRVKGRNKIEDAWNPTSYIYTC